MTEGGGERRLLDGCGRDVQVRLGRAEEPLAEEDLDGDRIPAGLDVVPGHGGADGLAAVQRDGVHAGERGGADPGAGGAGLVGGDLVADLLAGVGGLRGELEGPHPLERSLIRLGLELGLGLRLGLGLGLELRLGLGLGLGLGLELRLGLELGLRLGPGLRLGLGKGLGRGLGPRSGVGCAAVVPDLGRGGREAGHRLLGVVGERR
ncbi:hypothetical protein [Planomonospora venezuelensis]|uniref:hypothetical protein n=1 Tax=Planomonospora venezuelensis TaxID=1999 RepID=UPI0031E712E6